MWRIGKTGVAVGVALMAVLAAPALQGGTCVSPEEVARAVRAYLEERCAGAAEQAEIQVHAPACSVAVPSASYQLHVASDTRTRWKGSVVVRVEVEAEGRVVHRAMVTAIIRTYADVLVAERMIGRHLMPGKDDIRSLRMETTLIQRPLLKALTELDGLRSRQVIPRGTILYEDLFEPVPLVQQGDCVLVQVQLGGVSLRAEGVAKENGYRGAFIHVVLARGRDQVRARVDGIRAVTVPLEEGKEKP